MVVKLHLDMVSSAWAVKRWHSASMREGAGLVPKRRRQIALASHAIISTMHFQSPL